MLGISTHPATPVLLCSTAHLLLSHAGVMMVVVVVVMAVMYNHNHLRLRRIGYREAEKKNQSE